MAGTPSPQQSKAEPKERPIFQLLSSVTDMLNYKQVSIEQLERLVKSYYGGEIRPSDYITVFLTVMVVPNVGAFPTVGVLVEDDRDFLKFLELRKRYGEKLSMFRRMPNRPMMLVGKCADIDVRTAEGSLRPFTRNVAFGKQGDYYAIGEVVVDGGAEFEPHIMVKCIETRQSAGNDIASFL